MTTIQNLPQAQINPKTQQSISSKNALLSTILAEFDAKADQGQAAINQYIPLALYTPSINAKRRTFLLSLEYNDLNTAFAVANAWVEQEPNDVPALLYLAHTAVKTHRYARFSAVLEQILKLDENANLEQILTGILPEEQQDRDLLLDTLNSIQNKKHPSLLALIASLEAKNKQYQASLKHINAALRKRPNTTSFILLKANLLIEMNRADDALKWLHKVGNRQKNNTDVRLAEIQLLIKNKHEQQAFARMQDTLKYNPNAEDVLFLAGLTSIDFKNYDQAEHYLLKLRDSARYQNDAYYYLAINAERRQHFDAALAYYRMVDGNLYVVSRQAMIELFIKNQQFDEALRFLTQERVNQPNHASFLYQAQANLLQSLGQPAEALTVLQEAAKDLPEDPDLLYAQVLLLDAHEDEKELDQILNKLLQLEPNNPTYLNAYAYTLALQNKRLTEAKKYAEQALQQSPNQAAILDTLGYIAFIQNDFDTASQMLKQAYEHSDSINIAIKYARALYMQGDLTAFAELLQTLKSKYPDNTQVQQLDLLILPESIGTSSEPPAS
ncbi:MAG: tetratricopeptide repeat protein [Acinetobacter sp.]|nr:tetratricopeptide repeat protein [Acinetobacter sp.]